MRLRELQRQQAEWQSRNFGAGNENSPAWATLGVVEELGEFCHALLKEHQRIRGREDRTDDLMDAVGDMTIFLLGVCNHLGLDYEECIHRAWKEVKARDWKRFPQNGGTA